MAQVLADWAIRDLDDRVVDAGFGGAVFLRAAHQRLVALGLPADQAGQRIYGVEYDEEAFALAHDPDLQIPEKNLVCDSFFSVGADQKVPQCQAAIGNPRYVRYQGFNAWSEVAHELAATAGVPMTRLASSWAPFIVHAVSFVAPRGRMAQVLPAELLHAQYGEAVLAYLQREFASVTIAVFEERIFPGAMEEVVLLFADSRAADRLQSPVCCNAGGWRTSMSWGRRRAWAHLRMARS